MRTSLDRLAGRISAADMRAMNHAADAQRVSPADVASRFLQHLDVKSPSAAP
jgi:glycine betaine/choline ABC-type transport system substrate-binding protein